MATQGYLLKRNQEYRKQNMLMVRGLVPLWGPSKAPCASPACFGGLP